MWEKEGSYGERGRADQVSKRWEKSFTFWGEELSLGGKIREGGRDLPGEGEKEVSFQISKKGKVAPMRPELT